MPKNRRVSINAIGQNLQKTKFSEEEERMKSKIKELKGKIKMKERRKLSEVEKNKVTIEENEQIILEMRAGNNHLRAEKRNALDIDKVLVSEVLADRKRERLALSGKSSEESIKELDQTVCDLARRMNELVHIRQQRMEKVTQLQKKLETKTIPYESETDDSMESRQLENSLNKVQLKTSTAFSIKGVYNKIHSAIEDELRVYPNKLDNLEKHILCQRQEINELTTIQNNALMDRDETVASKTELEKSVREDRKEREGIIRNFRRKVKEVAMSELPHTSKKTTRHNADAEQQLAELARKTENRLEKIKLYQEKANMIEIVTGIPFVNYEGIVNCFRNQKNSCEYLSKKTKINQKLLRKNKKLLENLVSEQDELQYQHERRVQEMIENLEREDKAIVKKKKQILKKNSEYKVLLSQVKDWLEPVTARLMQACDCLNLKVMKSLKERGLEMKVGREFTVHQLFTIFVQLLFELSKEAQSRRSPKLSDTNDISNKKRDEETLLDDNNNRILATLERKTSEDFDYNTPSNDEYISRDVIKRQSESRQRRKNY